MAQPGQQSFNRTLLSRILIVSLPILLIGEAVALSKVSSSLLEAAHRSLSASALKKGESIGDAVAALKANLLLASQTTVLQSGSTASAQKFIDQLARQLPKHVQCVQLTNWQSGKLVASNCGQAAINSAIALNGWRRQLERSRKVRDLIHAKVLLPQNLPEEVKQLGSSGLTRLRGQLQLLLSAPVYNNAGQPRYALSIQSALYQPQPTQEPGALTGSTVVITQDGTILAHPFAQHIGHNIQQEEDAERLKSIVRNALAGRQELLNVSLSEGGEELIAGYTSIPSPITNEPKQRWLVLDVTPVENVLVDYQEIKRILFLLTIGLVTANILATLYLARELTQCLKKLQNYALSLKNHADAEPVVRNFQVREFSQVAEALESMLQKLKSSAQEKELAWQEAQAANQLKSEFLATTSHELRTPLNAIIGCVRLVRDGCCDDREEEMEFLERADEAAIHLLGIINNILDIAKIEAGKISLVLEPIDFRQLLKEVINIQTVNIQQKGLQLITHDGQVPIPIQADAAKLKQVLINVIGNAVKFTDKGSITIRTRIDSAADYQDGNGTPRVVVTVQDTGVGIEPAQQHKLFRPFVMVDDISTRKFGGTGLGLAISRNLIELMGGSITLGSPGVGHGTTVTMTLPLHKLPTLSTKSKADFSLKTSEGQPKGLAPLKEIALGMMNYEL